jgi:hypothetical protein
LFRAQESPAAPGDRGNVSNPYERRPRLAEWLCGLAFLLAVLGLARLLWRW